MWWWLACTRPSTTLDFRDRAPPITSSYPSPDDTAAATPTPHTGEVGPGDSSAGCAPPAGIEVALPVGAALPGATVPLGAHADTPTWPQAPVERSDGSAPILFSDSPETVDEPGLLYADVLAGDGRLYLYHASGAAALRYGVVARAVGAPATVTVTAAGVAGPSTDYLYTGRMAATRWLTARRAPAPRDVAVPTDRFVTLDDAVSGVRVAPGRLMHGIWDVSVAGAAEVRFVAVADGQDPAALADGLPALPRDAHDRGTFVPADRSVRVPCLDTAAGSTRVRLADGVSDPFAAGIDAVTGAAETLAGNYGVRYAIDLDLQASDGRWVAVLIAPRGGALAGGVRTSDGLFPGTVLDVPRDADDVRPGDAVLLGVWDPAVHAPPAIEWTPAGSSSLPVDLLLVAFQP